jgi:hypothetical protein
MTSHGAFGNPLLGGGVEVPPKTLLEECPLDLRKLGAASGESVV